jgi:hypothetical protein
MDASARIMHDPGGGALAVAGFRALNTQAVRRTQGDDKADADKGRDAREGRSSPVGDRG